MDTYISREIARQTNQWRLGDMRDVKSASVTFDREKFEAHLASHQNFQLELQRALQTNGQTAFYIGYEDIPDIDILNGLVRFLGVEERKKRTSKKTKKQNPQSLEEKVVNYAEMEIAISSIDYFGLNRTPNFEPRRGPMVPNYLAAANSPVLYMPIKSGPTDCISQWLADLDGVAQSDLIDGFTQKSLRQWKRQAIEHRSFTVIRHPVARLHCAFVKRILMPGPMLYHDIRETLRKTYGVPLPETNLDASYDATAHRGAFLAFLEFVKGNLAGQTGIRVDGAWASQSELLRGMGQFLLPTHIFRESEISVDLAYLARQIGRDPPKLKWTTAGAPITLAEIYDEDIEAAVRSVYQRDYMMFGFGPWRGPI
ncbi:MAG: sulfotransferase family 2 domain-containing protein [Paracoccaceae bacterium]